MARKILIVEDEKILSEMYAERFAKAGFFVCSAFSAEQALMVAKKEKPDIILLDILLPVGDGLSFLEAKQKILGIASIPVVAFSNYDDAETKRKAIALGAFDYLLKTSFTPKQIVDRIEQLLHVSA